jgi:nucleoside-diphosphate-sugar epimerase
VKVFLTGGTGFIGGEIARQLRRRGDEVACLVRTPAKATRLTELGCRLVAGDLADIEAIRGGMSGCDAVIHAAAMYEVGIPASQRQPMREANVGGTENVLGAALEAKLPKVVYVSTVGIGQTHGETVDESFEAPDGPFASCYEETKWQAHQVAKRLIGEGLPCTIVQPGGVYGPGDTSSLGQMIDQFLSGKMPLIPFPDTGLCFAHVEDTAAGIVLALDQGKAGEAYFLSGPATTIRGAIETIAKVSGRKAPKRAFPTPLLKAMTPIGPLIGKMLGQPPNLRELISAADGVTYWASNEKARRELGYAPRGLEEGLRATLETEGKLPATAAA